MIDAEQIDWLCGPEGADLLRDAASLPADTLTRLRRLRKRTSPERAAAVVALLELRARATGKFARADRMYFTPQGLEQASGDVAAAWRAARFPEGARIADLCCGIGGDTVHLARRGAVAATDLDPAAAACAEANAHALDAAGSVRVECADATAGPLDADAAFLDPSRRRDGRRVRSAGLYEPPLAFARDVLARVRGLAVKVSPAIDDAEIAKLGGRVEFVSVNRECREAVAWLGDIGPSAARSASVLPAGVCLAAAEAAPPPRQSPPRAWMLEPDPAVIRAHLIAEAAELAGACQVDPRTAWLTADARPDTPLLTAYPVAESMPFSMRKVQARLRALGRRVTAIKTRAVPLDPDVLRRDLTGAGDLPTVVVLTRVAGAVTAILCDPPVR